MASTVGLSLSYVNRVEYSSAITGTQGADSESLTTTPGTANQSTLSPVSNKQILRVSVSGGNIWLHAAPSGSGELAAVGTTFFLPNGSVEYFTINSDDLISVFESA